MLFKSYIRSTLQLFSFSLTIPTPHNTLTIQKQQTGRQVSCHVNGTHKIFIPGMSHILYIEIYRYKTFISDKEYISEIAI